MIRILIFSLASWLFGTQALAANSTDYALGPRQRHAWHCAAVLGDYMFIESGESSTYIDGKMQDPNWGMLAINSTRVIPLNKAWTPETIEFGEIPRPDGILTASQCALWADTDRNALYRWGGHVPHNLNYTKENKTQLYMLETDGHGLGTWTTRAPATADAFADIRAGDMHSYTSCRGLGFSIGGYSGRDTGYYDYDGPTPGVLSYNMSDSAWRNDTVQGLNGPNDSLMHAESVCIEGFGEKPLVALLGGSDIEMTSEYRDLTNPPIFDPVLHKWYYQQETQYENGGPDRRVKFCAVGVQSKNQTFEIFVYGGWNEVEQQNFNDIWILSLPAFRWFKAAGTGDRRQSHVCGVGGRQMISYGGLAINGLDGLKTDDPWYNGIGVFDMTKLEWRESFDPDLGDYEWPDPVREWYTNNDVSKVDFATDEIKELFLSNVKTTNIENPPGTDKNGSKSDSGLSPAALVGVVVGPITLILLLAAGGFWVVRLRRRRRPLQDTTVPSDWKDRGDWDKIPTTSSGSEPNSKGGELDSTPLSEVQCHASTIPDIRAVEMHQPAPVLELDATHSPSR